MVRSSVVVRSSVGRALCRIKFLPVTTLGKNLMIHVYNFGRPFFIILEDLFSFLLLSYFICNNTQQQ